MLDGNKNLFTSTTFWGVIISVVSIVLGMLKFDIGDQAGWVTDVTALVGAVVALIGRVKAVKKIGMFAAFMIAVMAMQSAMAAPPDSWSRNEWKYVGKQPKVQVFNLVVPVAGVASGDTISGVGEDLPPNAIVTNVTYHISTEFVGASDNAISMNCIASADLMTGLGLHGDAVNSVGSGGVIAPETHSGYVKTTSTGCAPTFYIGTGVTGYTAGALQALVEYMQLYPSEGLDE